MLTVRLDDRALIAVGGPDAEHFLQNILTVDLDRLRPGVAMPGALLSPQGKILFDFLISRTEGGFRLDCRAEIADDFVRRLMLYKLRAKVQISKADQPFVVAGWDFDWASSENDSAAQAGDSGWLRDARFPEAVGMRRRYFQTPATEPLDQYTRIRIANGIAESGSDFQSGDAFPHDVLLDQIEGVGFRKGCYIGQEVVSRMQHRGTARRRVLIVSAEEALPPAGTEITADGRAAGVLGSVSGRQGLAIARMDRVKDAIDAGRPLLAGTVALDLAIPAWATFTFPAATEGAEA